MNGFVKLIALGLFGAPLTAQTDYSPAAIYANREGERTSGDFGAYADARIQLADSSLRSRGRVITSVAFRLDYHNYDAWTGMGRQWRNVTLSMSQFNMAQMVKDPNANTTGTTTLVFSRPQSWPTQRGLPNSRPVSQELRMPFTTAWIYGGTQDILADFQFQGGQLSNGGTMGYSPLGPESPYYLDAPSPGPTMTRWGMPFSLPWPGGCSDTGSGRLGDLTMQARHHRPTATRPSSFDLALYGGNSVASTMITALGLGLHPAGTPLRGVSCQRLFVDFTAPTVLYSDVTNPATGYRFYRTLTGTRPIQTPAGLVGVPLVAQSAWSDTGTGAMRLTNASYGWVPALSPWADTAAFPRRAVYELIFRNGLVSFLSAEGQHNPICIYR